MSNEVSCKALDLFFRQAAKEGIPLDRLVEGSPHDLEYLRDSQHRMDWDVYVRLMENVGRIWSPEQLAEIGVSYFATGQMRHVGVIARLLFTAPEFYKFVFEQQKGAGNQVFSCIEPTVTEVGPYELQLDMRVEEGLAPCPGFFHTSLGNFQGMPLILGLRRADVTMSWIPRGATYRVKLPEGGGALSSVRKALAWPFTARAAARELRTAHEALNQRYRELERARADLARQTEAIQTANLLGRELAAKTELSAIYDALVGLLRSERFGYAAVALQIAEEPGGPLRKVREDGDAQGGVPRRYSLESSGDLVGILEVWGQQTLDEQDLLSALAPWVAIAIANGRSVSLLRRHQASLEHLVDMRTAELQKATRALEQSLARALEAEREKSRFFANASHELRTPLTLMVSPLEGLLVRSELPESAAADVKSSLSSAYRLLKLVNDLLDLAKLDEGGMRLRAGAVDLSQLTTESLRVWSPPLRLRNVSLVTELPPRAPMVGDPERIEQILHNLLANAAKHTPEGGTVTVRCTETPDGFELSIENTGEGIDPADLPALFDRFAQGSATRTRRFGSTGLGLPLVRDLCRLHGGDVTAESASGVTAFRVRLPRGNVDLANPIEAAAMSSTERRQYLEQAGGEGPAAIRSDEVPSTLSDPTAGRIEWLGSQPPLLLIVEDNPELRGFLERGLRSTFRILSCEDGVSALAIVREKHPDLILSDLMMPGMDGMALCRGLKSDPKSSAIPFLLLTARNDLTSKLKALGTGADDYILKPFHIEEVRARLVTHARLREAMLHLSLTERLASLGTVVAGVAHELRNPLNAVVNALRPAAELLSDSDAEAAALLDVASQAAQRAVELSTRLLDGIRVDPSMRLPIDIRSSLGLALDLMRVSVKDIHLEQDLPREGEAMVYGEPGALTQVWVNLVENAVHAAGPGGKVRVSAQIDGDRVAVRVTDSGPGIPEADLRRLFDPFFTTKAPGQGTGLGLSLARQAVLSHAGSIAASSLPGSGAEFVVTLPLASEKS